MMSERIPTHDQPCRQEGGAPNGIEPEVQRLMNIGKFKQAVELAKNHHKQMNTTASQRLLVQAYVARIEEFQKKGMAEEAQTLLTLVQQRFPAERHQLGALEVRAAAVGGRLHDLLRPLASDQTAPEIRSTIEAAVAQQITDLPAVAACDALSANHPLRLGAAAVWRAFLAVTAGPVTDDDISLPEISHRSPLSAWKMLVRAIAAYYRGDDPGCLRALDAIPADSAIAHVAAAVRGLTEGKKPASGIAAALFSRVLASDAALRSALEKLETALDSYDLFRLQGCLRDAVRACSQSRPELLERLRQHISIACFLRDVPANEVATAMGTTAKNSYFWRLLARAAETEGTGATAAMYWERFLQHGAQERMFAPASVEAATIWLHIGKLLSRLSLDELDEARRMPGVHVISGYYVDQPPEIAALRPTSDAEFATDLFEPGRPFQKAAMIRPDVETFQRWWAWAEQVDLPVKKMEDIALQWHEKRPKDAEPLLILTSLAEKRNALSLALKRLGEAEAIDPLNQQVRQARVRLTLSIAWRHFADHKPHLVQNDLAELAALPGMTEGDRAAALESMRGAWHSLRGDLNAMCASFQSVVDRVGPIAAPALFTTICVAAKLHDQLVPSQMKLVTEGPPLEIALASARLFRVARDLELRLMHPKAWVPAIEEVLRQRPCPLSESDLLALGRGGLNLSETEMAYSASSAGLAKPTSPATTARFLLVRARSLNKSFHQPRTTQCLRAALQLARQAHDEKLSAEIFTAIDRDPFTRRVITHSRNGQEMADDVLSQVLESERNAAAFPRNGFDANSFVVDPAASAMADRFGGDAPEFDWDEEDDTDDEDDDDAEPTLFDSDPESLAQLDRFVQDDQVQPEDLIANPKSVIESMAKAMGVKVDAQQLRAMIEELAATFGGGAESGGNPFGGQSKKRRKRRR
jgi:hypothetical protein